MLKPVEASKVIVKPEEMQVVHTQVVQEVKDPFKDDKFALKKAEKKAKREANKQKYAEEAKV